MKAFCITLNGHEYSERVAERCIKSAAEIGGIEVKRFPAVDSESAEEVMRGFGLRWAWGNGCKKTGLRHHAYGGELSARIGCAMSHYSLWQWCVEANEPLLILEHDAVFLREFPVFEFAGICQINDPEGATRRGKWWHDKMVARGTTGVHPKTRIPGDSKVPDGLAGNSAYVIKPAAALSLIAKYKWLGVWPNDATMCVQLFPYLEEYYPFVTRVEQTLSTTSQ